MTFTIAVLLTVESSSQPADEDILISSEIYNGNDAGSSRARWMAWVRRMPGGKLACGGVLISNAYVVTVASCVKRPGSYQVVLGDYDRSTLDGSEVIIDVAKRHLHPEYEMTRADFPLWSILTLQNDIAILELETPVDLSNKNITKLNKLSDGDTDTTILDGSARCLVTGWGYNYFEGSWMLSPRPQELDIDVMTDKKCSKALMELYDSASKLCYENSGSGTCMGDSGGAWVCDVNNKWTLVAIQSYGVAAYGIANNDCRDGIRAGTRISHYIDWIKSITKSRKRRIRKNGANRES